MIRATVARTAWASGVTGYEVKAEGHAGAGEYGQDIVCAAVSVLLQTLANEVVEAARAGLLAVGVVAHGDGWMKVEATPTAQTQDMVEAWVQLVQDGIDALAESYPENVELTVHLQFADGKAPDSDELADMVSGKMNLQYFADGGDGGAGAAEGGAAEAAAPAVQEPALRPAQERLARRSGALKGKAAGGEKLPQPPAGGSPLKEGASGSESDPAEAEKHQEPAKEPKAEKTPEERFAIIEGYGLPTNIARMERDLKRYKINYDVWFRESTLHESGYVKETIDLLTAKGATYETEDGALWLRSTDFGCDKDDVLRRANGFYTYFAADIAYHRNKFEKRGFDRVINIWGADHHGHVKRLQCSSCA